MQVRALSLTVVVVLAGAAAELTGEGRLPFGDLRWRGGMPEILADGRWQSLRAVEDIPASTLVADEIAAEGPAFADHFASDLERLVERRGGRWGPLIALDVQDGGEARRIHQLATHLRRRALRHALDERTVPVGGHGEMPLPPRIDGTPSWPYIGALSAEEAEEDLGVLAWHLDHRLASPRTDVPWRAALASIRGRLGPGISRRDFAIELMSALALFDDGHIRLRRAESRIALSKRVLPVRFVSVGRNVACVSADERRLCSQSYPLLLAIDGVPLASIARALSPLVPAVSPDFERGEILDLARDQDLVRVLAGGKAGDTSTLLLGDGNGRMATQVVHPKPVVRERRASSVEARILETGDGYLALRDGWPPGDAFAHEIDDAFRAFRNAPRLIIDVRGNRGGDRGPVLHLLRHLLPADDRVIDIAAYRADPTERPSEQLNILSGHGFRLPAKRDQAVLAAVRARWPLPPSAWSGWYVATLGTTRHEPVYDGPVLVLVDEGSASATALLTSALASAGRATVAGLEGGGGGGWPVDVRLPHSRLVVSLPAMFAVQPDGTDRHAIVPQVSRMRSLDDLMRDMEGQPPLWALTARWSAGRGWPTESGTTASPGTP